LPEKWRLNLPLLNLNFLAVSDFAKYLECPFSFYLERVLKMRKWEHLRELDAVAFGSACHRILKIFAEKDADLADEKDIADSLRKKAEWWFEKNFGADMNAVLRLQCDAVCGRLALFAREQARLRREGWSIVRAEFSLDSNEFGIPVNGRCDRVDFRDGVLRVMDYKTGDTAKNILERAFTTSKADREFAASINAPLFQLPDEKECAWKDLQLPLYAMMLDAKRNELPPFTRVECAYFELGASDGNARCEAQEFSPLLLASARETARVVAEQIKAGIFWPPRKLGKDFEPLFPDGKPELGVSAEWIADQTKKITSEKNEKSENTQT